MLVASSTKTRSVQGSPRSSNQRCSEPSIWINSPKASRRRRGWWNVRRCLRDSQRPSSDIHFAQRLARNPEAVMRGAHLGRQRRPEVRVALADQRQGVIALAGVEPIVCRPSARLVPDRGRAVRSVRLQQTEHLALRKVKNRGAGLDAQLAVIDLRQDLDAVQLATRRLRTLASGGVGGHPARGRLEAL
jgi:hypothetical protein